MTRASSLLALVLVVLVVWLLVEAARSAGETATSATPIVKRATVVTLVRYRGRTAREWAMRYRARTSQVQRVRRVLYARSSVVEAINLACATYGSCSTLWRRARCESGYSPSATNGSGASGLFQFLDSTWRSTPFARFSVWSPYANALAAGWMHAHGRGGEWACR